MIKQWRLCSFDQEDLRKIRYINYSYWNDLSRGTHLPVEATKTIRNGIAINNQGNEVYYFKL